MTDHDDERQRRLDRLAELELAAAEQDQASADAAAELEHRAREALGIPDDLPESPAATELRELIERHFPDLDLFGEHETKWYELGEDDDVFTVAVVDGGSTMFARHGDDLHVVGAVGVDLGGADPDGTVPDENGVRVPVAILAGQVPCFVIRPDGRYYLACYAEDPLGAIAASRN